jgi:type II secretory pathway predicted ATPase ExeA
MRKITIITGEQGTGKTMLAQQILNGEQKTAIEVDGIKAFIVNLKAYGSLLDYIVDGVSLIELKKFLTELPSARRRDFNMIITLQQNLSDEFIADNAGILKDVSIIRTIKY